MSGDTLQLEHITPSCWRVVGEPILVLHGGDREYLLLWVAANRIEPFPSLKEACAAIERKVM